MALTAMRTMEWKQPDDPRGDYVELPVAASTTIYSGGLIGMLATGYVEPYVGSTVATTLTGSDRLIGVAKEDVDNSAGAAGAKTVKVLTSGCFYHAVSGLAITDVGTPVYATADDTLTKVSLGNAFVGWVERFVASGYGMIRLAPPGHVPPIFNRWSLSIETVAANIALLIHPTENQNGLLVLWAGALITETFAGDTEDQGIITLQDTAGTTLGATFTAADAGADAVNDIIAPLANKVAIGAASGSLLVPVPAGLGVQAKVTQLTSGASEQGAMKVGLLAVPIG
jgi:hypothetical protein